MKNYVIRAIVLLSMYIGGSLYGNELIKALEQNRPWRDISSILDTGIDINERDELGNTPLRIALRMEAPDEIIALLLTRGAHTDDMTTDVEYALRRVEKTRLKEIQNALPKLQVRAFDESISSLPSDLVELIKTYTWVPQQEEQDDEDDISSEGASGPGITIATLDTKYGKYSLDEDADELILRTPSRVISLGNPFYSQGKPIEVDGEELKGSIKGATMQLKEDPKRGSILYTLVELDTIPAYAVIYSHKMPLGNRVGKVGLKTPIPKLKKGLSDRHKIPQDIHRIFLDYLQASAQKTEALK